MREEAKPAAPAPETAVEPGRPELALPDKPSVAVLPFNNMSGDPQWDFVAEGIVDDIITALSNCPWLSVIARNSSFAFRGGAVDVKHVGRELGVRYVLEGSLRQSGSRVRITTQLVETESGKHVWAERYDRDLVDIFVLQDEITQAVTVATAPAIADAELRRAIRNPTGSVDAWNAYQRGLWHLFKFSTDDNALAQKNFQRAIDLDPTFGDGYKGLAWAYMQATTTFQTRPLPEAQNPAEALARQAVALDPVDAEARSTLGMSLYLRGDHQGAIAEAEQALAISPNFPSAHAVLGAALIFSGRPLQGRLAVETAIRLDPHEPYLVSHLNYIAVAFYFCREYEAAIDTAKRAVRTNPDYPLTYRWLAAALGQLDRSVEAKEALEKAIAAAPAWFDLYVHERVPWMRSEDHAHMLDGLRKAGMPEG